MSELDPRLERHRPALVYDSQEAYRAMSAALITDYPGNVLRDDGDVIARAGQGLSLADLHRVPARRRDRLDEAPPDRPPRAASQADPVRRRACTAAS